MKRIVLIGIILSMLFSGVAMAASGLTLIVNGKVAPAEMKVIDGVTYVPLRAAGELLGATVNYDAATKTITINGKDYDPEAANKPPVKSYNVDINIASGPMTMHISKVTLNPNFKPDSIMPAIQAVILETDVENTSDQTVRWYPNHGVIVTNTKEQIEARGIYSDQVGGEFIGKVIKKGKIAFEVQGDIQAITSFNYKIDGPYNDQYDEVGPDQTTEIILQ